MFVCCVDGQTAASIHRQVCSAENDAVHVAVVIAEGVGAAAAKRVFRALR